MSSKAVVGSSCLRSAWGYAPLPGTRVFARDITLPDGVELAADPELVVALVAAAPTAAEMEGEATEAAPVAEEAGEPAEAAPAQA